MNNNEFWEKSTELRRTNERLFFLHFHFKRLSEFQITKRSPALPFLTMSSPTYLSTNDKRTIRELLEDAPTADNIRVLHKLAHPNRKNPARDSTYNKISEKLTELEMTQIDEIIDVKLDFVLSLFPNQIIGNIAGKIHHLLQHDVSIPYNETNFFHSLTPRFETETPSGVKLNEGSIGKSAYLSFRLRPLHVAAQQSGEHLIEFISKYPSELGTVSSCITEGSYNMTVVLHPSQMVSHGMNKTAGTILAENYPRKPKGEVKSTKSEIKCGKLYCPSKLSKPECGAGINEVRRPPLSFEINSFQESGIEEIIQTSSGHIQASYFVTDPCGLQSSIFYEEPPWGLACLACGPAVMCVFRAELVGVLHLSPYAGAFTLGSQEHLDLVKELEEAPRVSPTVDLGTMIFQQCTVVGVRTLWTTEAVNEKFYKVIAFDLYDVHQCPQHWVDRPMNWRRLYHIYKKYSLLTDLPEALLPARLLFGEYQVCFNMRCDTLLILIVHFVSNHYDRLRWRCHS